MITGNVAIVLNAHFPYVRRAGRWPHGEEALHGVIAESYVPLLAMLYDLRNGRQVFPLTVSISPVLLEQLADPVINKHMLLWLAEYRGRVEGDLAHFEAEGNGHGAYLARFYGDWLEHVEGSFAERFGRNLVAATRGLLRETSDVLLVPATYAYLPHLSPVELRAQLEVGAMSVLRHLGKRPSGLWLPGGGMPAGLRDIADELGLAYCIGSSRPTTSRSRRHSLPTVHPDGTLLEHVVAPGMGYPGDGMYRDFYRHHPVSGIPYWRVTGVEVPQGSKAWYDPYIAFGRVEEHAAHFVRAVRERLRVAGTASVGQTSPGVVIAFDVDLFGHWWFEGVRWLQHVLVGLLEADDVQLTTASELQRQVPPVDGEPSGPHPIFDGPAVAELRQRVAAAGSRLTEAARLNPTAQGLVEALLGQATRELLLAQSSDWPTLIATDMAQEYAERRCNEHLERFNRLIDYATADAPPPEAESYLHEVAELDNPFPHINYRLFS